MRGARPARVDLRPRQPRLGARAEHVWHRGPEAPRPGRAARGANRTSERRMRSPTPATLGRSWEPPQACVPKEEVEQKQEQRGPQQPRKQLGSNEFSLDGRGFEFVEEVLETALKGFQILRGVCVSTGDARDPLQASWIDRTGRRRVLLTDHDGIDLHAALMRLLRSSVRVETVGIVNSVGEENDDLALRFRLFQTV